jgi:PAS domain S-box-containing protein
MGLYHNDLRKLKAISHVLDKAALVSESDLSGTITYVNEKFCEISQYSPEELLGKPHSLVRHPDTPKELFAEMWRTIRSGQTYQGVIKNKAKDGSPYWVDVTISPLLDEHGQIEKYLGIRFDVSEEMLLNEKYKEALSELEEKNESLALYHEELKQNIEELKQTQSHVLEQYKSSEAYRLELQARISALNASAIVSESDLFGNITFVNEKFCLLSKYSRDELIGKPHSIIRHPDTPSEVFQDLWKTIKSGNIFQKILKNKAKDGSPYWVETTIVPVLGEDFSPVKYVSVRYDITAQIKAREDITHLLHLSEKAYEELRVSRVELAEKKLMSQSISYAKRIQEALLPSKQNFLNSFSSAFVLYMPKDVVSGDFYWHHKSSRYNVVAAIDCTGHGVPGAFMSVMANSLMNNIVMEQEIYEPALILSALQEKVVQTLRQSEPNGQIHDGLDIALCVIDRQTNLLKFAGANRPLYISKPNEIVEIKGDKIPIGGETNVNQEFTQHRVQMSETDKFYIFSDGYCDQFGGAEQRRFSTKRLKEYLKSIYHVPLHEHGDLLKANIHQWINGKKLIDDIIMIGFQM